MANKAYNKKEEKNRPTSKRSAHTHAQSTKKPENRAAAYRASGVRRELNPGTLLGPLPAVMVTCGSMEESDIVTVAWTGITSTKPPTLYISLRPERHSHGLIKESGEFVVNLVPSSMAKACDWCGMYSGRDRDKFADCPTKLTKCASKTVSCPTLAESPLALECKVISVTPLGSHDMFLASIRCMTVDESLVDENGRLCLERAKPLAFHHGEYYASGEKVGEFGFAVRKK